jgi:flagellin
MGLGIATDVAALGASRALGRTDRSVETSLRRLASGLRIATAADDATGLGVSEGLRAQVRGMTQAVRNTQDGIGLLRTADAALDSVHAMLRRMRDLAVQGGNAGLLDAQATAAVRAEFEQLKSELDDVAGRTSFNGRSLLDGTYDRLFQAGAEAGDTVRVVIAVSGRAVDVAGLGLSDVDLTGGLGLQHTLAPAVAVEPSTPAPGRLTLAGDYTSGAAFRALTGTVTYDGRTLDLGTFDYTGAVTVQDRIDRLDTAAIAALGTSFSPFVATATGLVFTAPTPGPTSTAADARAMTPYYAGDAGTAGTLRAIDRAIGWVSDLRAHVGAMDNRFSSRVDRLNVSIENATASESRIRDVDVAAEVTALTRSQVVAQAGTAMLAQANQSAGRVLALLR